MAVSRADTSVLGRWWWTVDRWTLAALLALIGFGYVMMLAASPGCSVRVTARGPEAEKVMAEIEELIALRFGEEI